MSHVYARLPSRLRMVADDRLAPGSNSCTRPYGTVAFEKEGQGTSVAESEKIRRKRVTAYVSNMFRLATQDRYGGALFQDISSFLLIACQ